MNQDQRLKQELMTLRSQVNTLNVHLLRRENELMKKQLKCGPQITSPASGISDVMNNLPFYLAPGNVGDVNNVIWPFWFPTKRVVVAPDQVETTSFEVSQTADFIATHYTKAVFLREDLGAGNFRHTYINPDDPIAAGQADGLTFAIRDASSSREFMDRSIALDHVGNPRFPTVLTAPQLVRRNTALEVTFENQNPATTFVTFISFFGIRIRIEDADSILSMVTQQGK